MSAEKWAPIAGYEGAYEVSDQGRIRSLTREVYAGRGRTRKHEGRLLSVYAGDKYSKVRLKLDGDGGSTKNVHQLVAEAFLGARPDGLEVCHNNSNAHDNRVGNLRYDTHVANIQDAVRIGHAGAKRKTECQHGHELTPENLYTSKRARGGVLRLCKTCALARDKRYREQRAAA